MSLKALQTFTLAQKEFCWSGIGARATAAADRNMAPHQHSFFQVVFVASGTATHEIGSRVFLARRGGIVFVKPYTVHRVTFPADSECWVLYFSAQFIQQSIGVPEEVAARDQQLYRLPELAPFIYQPFCSYELDDAEIKEAIGRCQRISERCESRGIFDAACARGELTLLLTSVGRKYADEFRRLTHASDPERPMDKRARAAVGFLRDNFNQRLTLADAARKVNLSGTYLTHLLKQETGKSFKQLLDEIRLENSKKLLAYTDDPLQRIAADSGFIDQAHFAKRFKAYAQVTPGQFRRRHHALAGAPESD